VHVCAVIYCEYMWMSRTLLYWMLLIWLRWKSLHRSNVCRPKLRWTSTRYVY